MDKSLLNYKIPCKTIGSVLKEQGDSDTLLVREVGKVDGSTYDGEHGEAEGPWEGLVGMTGSEDSHG